MTERTIKYKSYNRVSCSGCTPADIVICVTPAKILGVACDECSDTETSPATKHYIDGQLQTACRLQDTCGTYFYQYILSYNDDQLVLNEVLAVSDILGIFCKGCMTDWVEDLVGTPGKICSDEGVYTYTNSQGCEFAITQTPITVVDTDSIDLNVSGTVNHTLSATLILSDEGESGLNPLEILDSGLNLRIDPTSNNALQAIANTGLHVAAFLGTTGGAANAQTLTTSPATVVIRENQIYSIIAGFTNTAATTLNINSVSQAVVRQNGRALIGNEIISGNRYLILDNGTSYVLLNPSSEWQTWVPANITGYSAEPTNTYYGYKVNPEGTACLVVIREATDGTSDAADLTIALPIPAATVTNAVWAAEARLIDNSVALSTFGSGLISSAGNSINFTRSAANGVGDFTTSGGKRVASFQLEYRI